jgi:very-short-patch-repair endonuclease
VLKLNMKRKIIPYNPKLKPLAKDLRNNSTLGEVILWKKLKGKQFLGYDFHRQKPLLEYIVDFYCPELHLVIEIDGKYHEHADFFQRDVQRQQRLEEYNLHFLRFTEKEIRTQLLNVLRAIEIYIEEFQKHTPNPSLEGNLIVLKETEQ